MEMCDVTLPLNEYVDMWYSLSNITQEAPMVCSCVCSYFLNSPGTKESGSWGCEARKRKYRNLKTPFSV